MDASKAKKEAPEDKKAYLFPVEFHRQVPLIFVSSYDTASGLSSTVLLELVSKCI